MVSPSAINAIALTQIKGKVHYFIYHLVLCVKLSKSSLWKNDRPIERRSNDPVRPQVPAAKDEYEYGLAQP
jgi:hypothetical protein